MADNEIIIKVKSENDTKAGFDEAKADAELAGDQIGEGFLARFAARLNGNGGNTGGIAGVIAENMGLPEMGGLAAGMLVAAPAIAGLLVEITGVVNGLVAAAAGIGAFGLLALPTLDKIKNQYVNLQTAQQGVATAQKRYNDAVEKQKLDPTKANAQATATALLNLKVAQEDAAKAATPTTTAIQGLLNEFKMFAQPLQPVVLQVVNDALQIASSLLPYVSQFATAAAPAIEQVMTSLSKGVSSQGFADFVSKMTKISPAAITAIAGGIGKVASAVGQLLTVMSSHDVAHAINIAFDIIAGSIRGFADWVKGAMNNWDRFEGAMKEGWHNIDRWAHDFNNDVHGFFDEIGRLFSTDPRNWYRDIKKVLDPLPGDMLILGMHMMESLASGIRSAMGSVLSAIGGVAGIVFDHLPHSPAKTGPLSGAGSPDKAGQRIAEMLASGMRSRLSTVSSAAGAMAGAAGGGIGGGAGGGVQLVISGAGAAQFQQLVRVLWPSLMLEVRNRGGGGKQSVQIALGQTH